MPDPAPIPDRHVHTEWSWDAAFGEMTATCARAVELGLPAVAFTEHADFVAWVACPATGGAPPVAGSRKDSAPPMTGAPPNRWAWSTGHLPGHRWPVRTPVTPSRSGYLDIAGYWAAIGRCRAAFPGLRIELGSSSASRTSSPPRSPSCSRTVPSTASSARCTASRWRGSWST